MREIKLDELQKLQLDILKHFDAYCQRHNIRYFLYAGTLLGAVRHGGFIPWDDDIDLCVPRPDYERLYELCGEEPIAPHLELRSARDFDCYNAPFMKVVDKRTDGREDYLRAEFHSGVWIDLFPLDGLPEDESERAAHLEGLKKTQKTMEKVVRPYDFCLNPLRLAKRVVLYLRYHAMDYRAMANSMDERAKSYAYDASDEVATAVFDGWKRIFRREWFDKTIKLPFDSCEFNAPAGWRELLTYMYGDYMTPPPPEKQVSHHGYTARWTDGEEG